MNALTFQNTQFDIVDLDGQKWLRGLQIGSALGYSEPRISIATLYERNADEFTPSMTAMVKLPDLRNQTDYAGTDLPPQTDDTGQRREVRIFSLRGAHLLGMFANTEPAKDFRRWVLDVLEQANQPPTLVATVHNHLLVAKPKLAVTLFLYQSHININEMAKLLNTTSRKVEQHLEELMACGLIPSTSPETQLTLI
jgi:prophage antirepressor-like protein